VIDGVVRRVIEEAGGGAFVEPGNDEMLAATVFELAGDPERVKKMGQNARAYLVRHLDRRDKLEDTLELLLRIAKD